MMFSIGIPAYKAKFLGEAISSVLNQTISNFELIIVNDASPERIEQIVENFSDSRIRYYVNEQNFGAANVVDNWNKCLSFAEGDYFLLLGDDDVLAPNCLEEFSRVIHTFGHIDVYHCRSLLIDGQSKPFSLTPALPEYETVYENIWHRINGLRSQYVSDFVYRTSVLKQIGGFFKIDLAWAADDITSFIAMTKKGIVHINKPLLYYRRTTLTISSSGSVYLKLIAIEKEALWYNQFLTGLTPSSREDALLKDWIMHDLPKYLKKKRISTIAYSGYSSRMALLNFFYWLVRHRSYKLSYKEVFFSYVLALKKKHGLKAMYSNS